MDSTFGQGGHTIMEKRSGGFATGVAEKPIRVLVVDDSAVARRLLIEICERDPALQVVGTAPDAFVAKQKVEELHPDVITLDLEMPGMSGIDFLKRLMRAHPTPVIVVSSYTQRGTAVTLEALSLGAVTCVPKPHMSSGLSLSDYSAELVDQIKAAARAKIRPEQSDRPAPATSLPGMHPLQGEVRGIIAIGASTGGTEAIAHVLGMMPGNLPPIVIVQHIPPSFSKSFAERLDRLSILHVKEAEDGDELKPDCAFVAPGNRHLLVEKRPGRAICRLSDGPKVRYHRPSADVLFDSVAEHYGKMAAACLLTGMGEDGARGMLVMRQKGAYTIAQDEETSMIWGMPGAAVRMEAATAVLPLDGIAPALCQWAVRLAGGAKK